MNWERLLARHGVDITTASAIDACFYALIKEFNGATNELLFTSIQNRNLTHYVAIDSREWGRFLYKKYFNSPEQIKQYYKDGLKLRKLIVQSTKKWSSLGQESSTSDIVSAYNEFKEQYEKITFIYSITSWLAIESWQYDFDELINRLIKRNNKEKESESITTSIYSPWKKTATLEIQEKLALGSSLKEISREYAFLRSWCVVWHKPLDESWFASLQSNNDNICQYTLEKIKSLLKPNAIECNMLKIAPYISFFKDWRDDLRRFHAYSWSFLFSTLAQRWGISHDDVGYLTMEEIEHAIASQPDRTKINDRKQKGCIITIQNEKVVIIDELPQKYEDIMHETAKSIVQMAVRGLCANKGKVVGSVTLMRSRHDIKKVKDGDVLIANTTHPDYLPAMQRAAAFVTNEGGMLCHAAIVARETKKPCIVGTKNATEIFKDGDIVEVNALEGTVKLQ